MTDKPKAEIIFTGRLTKPRLKELYATHFPQEQTAETPQTTHNENTITLTKQEDGSYSGSMYKNGAWVTSRELMPEHALVSLLTHP